MGSVVSERAQRPSADATRQRILEAALDAFADQSFDGASLRNIASVAGVTQPLLNYHFRSKADLWRAVVDELFDRLNVTLGHHLRSLVDVEDRIVVHHMVRRFVEFSAHNPQLHRIITSECRADSSRMDYLVEQHIRPLYDAVTTLFARLAVAGDLPDIPPAHLYYLLTGAAPTMFVLGPECRRLSGLDPTDDDVIRTHADAVCTLLFGATHPQTGEYLPPSPPLTGRAHD